MGASLSLAGFRTMVLPRRLNVLTVDLQASMREFQEALRETAIEKGSRVRHSGDAD